MNYFSYRTAEKTIPQSCYQCLARTCEALCSVLSRSSSAPQHITMYLSVLQRHAFQSSLAVDRFLIHTYIRVATREVLLQAGVSTLCISVREHAWVVKTRCHAVGILSRRYCKCSSRSGQHVRLVMTQRHKHAKMSDVSFKSN
jgi:hypothetical protein